MTVEDGVAGAARARTTDLAGRRPVDGDARARPGTWTGGLVLFATLALVLPLVLARLDPLRIDELKVLLAWTITAYASFRLAQLYVVGEARIVELGFYAFVYLWMGLAPLAQVTAGRFPLAQEFTESTQVGALVTVLIGLAGYHVGQLLVRSRALGLRLPARLELAQVSPVRTWMLAGVGFVSVAVVTLTSGGLAVRFSSRQEAERAIFGAALDPGLRVDQAGDKALALIKGAFLSLPVFFALLLLLYLQHCARRRGATDRFVTSRAAGVLVAALVVANVVANNPLSSSRLRVGIIGFAILAVLVPPDTGHRFRVAIVGVLFIFLAVFPYADLFRYSVVIVDEASLADELVDSPDYGMFNQDMNAVLHVDEQGHTLGRQALGSVGSLVPRRVWADKPIATGDLISRSEDRINASSTLWAEAYVDGGRILVLVVFVAWGALSRLLSTAYVVRPRSLPVFAGAMVPIFAGMQIFIVRGALQPTMADLWPLLVMTLFCIPLASRTQVAAAQAHGDELGADRTP